MPTITDRTRKRLSQKQLRNQCRASRRQQARKARASRRQIDRIHDQLPKQVRTIFDPVEPAFTHPTHHRFILLALAAILTLRGRTIANLLRCLGSLAPGHPSSYHRIFSRDRWSSWTLARCFAQKVLARFVPEGPIELAGDDTVEEHPGKNVYGKGCHRDPVRSTHSFTAYRWGHKWVALTVLVRVPFATRRWALPLLMTLYLPEEENRRQGRRHKTPSELMQQMLAVLIHWFPDRQFIFTGDGGYGSHALASFAHRHCRHLSLVSLFYPNANLYDPPPVVLGKKPSHRPRKKGAKLPAPQAVVAATVQRKKLNVSWYGGGRRNVEVVSRTGQWYRSGAALIPILWVFVHDLTGTHRDTYLFTTDLSMTVPRMKSGPGRPGWLPTPAPHRSGLAHHAHPVPHLMNSRPARSVVGTWTWFRSRCTCQVSLQRLMRRRPLPSTGSLGLVPPLQRYYEVLRLPAAHFAALRFLRLAIPSLRPLFVPLRPRTRSRGSSWSW